MLNDIITWLAHQDAIRSQLFAFATGASITFAMSFFNKERRSCKMLISGAFLGGVGAVIALRTWRDSFWIPLELTVVVAALGFERLALAYQRVADDFSKNPFSVARKLLALFVAYGTALKNVKLDDGPTLLPPADGIPPDMQAQLDELDKRTGE